MYNTIDTFHWAIPPQKNRRYKLIPQTQRRLGLAALGFGRPWLVWGSSVVGIGLCTLDMYWDPLARAIVLRPLDRLWADTCVACGDQLACCSHCTQRSGASHCARALPF